MSVVPQSQSVLQQQGSSNYLTDAVSTVENTASNILGTIETGIQATASGVQSTADTVGSGLTSIGTGVQKDISLLSLIVIGIIVLVMLRPQVLEAVK